MEIIQGILEGIGKFFGNIVEGATAVFTATDSVELIYTAIVRWVFIFLAVFILSKAILSLLKSKNPSEVWAYLHIGDYENIPITHWENVIGRAKSCDIQVDDLSVSRNHGTLTRDNDGVWSYMDLGSKNGAVINGVQARPYIPVEVRAGDDIVMGAAVCTLFPVSIEEHNNNVLLRTEDTKLLSPWPSLLAITLFQILTVIQLKFALGDKFYFSSLLAFAGLCAVMWVYVIFLRTMKVFKIIMLLILIGIITAVGAVFYAFFVEPHKVTTENVSISDTEIKKDLTIAVFADTHFTFDTYTMEDFNKAVAAIKATDPDIIVFLGDLYDNYDKYHDNENQVISALSSLHA